MTVVAILLVALALLALAMFWRKTARLAREKEKWDFITLEALPSQLEWLQTQFARFRWDLTRTRQGKDDSSFFTFEKRDENSGNFRKVWTSFDKVSKSERPMIVADVGSKMPAHPGLGDPSFRQNLKG